MPITQVDIDDAQGLIDLLMGDQSAAEDYSKNPDQWLEQNGYANLNPEAVAQCGAAYGGGASIASTSAGAASSGVAGVSAVLNPVVYNHYYEDNSITNNIEANGDVDIDNTVQSVDGDGNVLAGDDIEDSNIQTGDGIQADEGSVDIVDSNVATGDDNQQAIDESTNVDVDVDVDGDDPDPVDL